MQTLFSRIAWFRLEQYILRHKAQRIAVAGTYGRTLVANMVYAALRQHRHVRLGYPVRDMEDIPVGMVGRDHETDHQNIISFLTGAWRNELHEKEPNTIIAELPLLQSGFIPYAASRILPNIFVLHHIANQEEEYKEALQYLARDVVVIANADDETIRNMAQDSGLKTITYGRNHDADIRISRAVRGDAGTGIFVELGIAGKHYEAFMPDLFAREHVSALAGAIACAYAQRADVQEALRGIASMKLPSNCLHRREGLRGEVLISEDAECSQQIIESLKSLASLPHTGRRIAVLQSNTFFLSGDESEKIAFQLAQAISLVLFVGDAMRDMQNIINAQKKNIDTHRFATLAEAMHWLAPHIKKDDLIYSSAHIQTPGV